MYYGAISSGLFVSVVELIPDDVGGVGLAEAYFSYHVRSTSDYSRCEFIAPTHVSMRGGAT